MLIRFFLLGLCFSLSQHLLQAQDADNPGNENNIIDPNIRSAQLVLEGAALFLPIMDINAANNTMRLQFDHIGEEIMDYSYTIVHCNSDWQPSELEDNQYIKGYAVNNVDSIFISQNTIIDYTHYFVKLPNSNMHWTKSGNYLLKILDNQDDLKVVLVRRFVVVEPQWSIDPRLVQTAMVDKLRTHQELDFTINLKNTRVNAPANDIKAFVLQNSRWDNCIGPIAPFGGGSNTVRFDYQDKIVFPAGLEYRFFDMRPLDYKGEFVRKIDQFPDHIEVTLKTDNSRFETQVVVRKDINGRYIIDNASQNRSLSQAEYANVLFSISQNLPLEDEDVYVFGELSDWQIKPEFKMEFNEEAKVYYCEVLLKQGYYNYEYRVVDRNTGLPSKYGFEGNWAETGNKYTILAYFRPFGARYDRLMGAVSTDTKPN